MNINKYADMLSSNENTELAEKAKTIVSSLSEDEISKIKQYAERANDIKELFSNPEFRKIIDGKRQL